MKGSSSSRELTPNPEMISLSLAAHAKSIKFYDFVFKFMRFAQSVRVACAGEKQMMTTQGRGEWWGRFSPPGSAGGILAENLVPARGGPGERRKPAPFPLIFCAAGNQCGSCPSDNRGRLS